jgi:hypothetical protein
VIFTICEETMYSTYANGSQHLQNVDSDGQSTLDTEFCNFSARFKTPRNEQN